MAWWWPGTGRLPVGADEAVAEAGGTAVVVGSGVTRPQPVHWWPPPGCGGPKPVRASGRPSSPHGWPRSSQPAPLVILPASPDGRDLAPRLAAALDRPLVSRAIERRVPRRSGTGRGPTGFGPR